MTILITSCNFNRLYLYFVIIKLINVLNHIFILVLSLTLYFYPILPYIDPINVNNKKNILILVCICHYLFFNNNNNNDVIFSIYNNDIYFMSSFFFFFFFLIGGEFMLRLINWLFMIRFFSAVGSGALFPRCPKVR